MIKNISVKNYRNLKDLEIPTLGRVNLIAGKNNTGKSSFLEALLVYLSRGNIKIFLELLRLRKELPDFNRDGISFEDFTSVLSSFFYNWNIDLFGHESGISIKTDSRSLHLQLVKYFEEIKSSKTGRSTARRIELTEESEVDYLDFHVGLKVTDDTKYFIWSLELFFASGGITPFNSEQTNFKYVSSHDYTSDSEKLWDHIILSPKESIVIEALRILEPNIERLAFVNHYNTKNRIPVVTLKGSDKRIPLSSMGDGMNKMLRVILTLVNTENGYLLIDEFENGLHHSAQENLWEIIFKFAYKYNVQVFATTHSFDSIYAWGEVANSEEEYSDSMYFRFDYKDEKVSVVEYEAELIRTAAEQSIETR